MYSNKLVVALFVGAISASQLPNMNMVWVGTSQDGKAEIQQRLETAYNSGNATINTYEAFQLRDNVTAWANSTEAQAWFAHLDNFSRSEEVQSI